MQYSKCYIHFQLLQARYISRYVILLYVYSFQFALHNFNRNLMVIQKKARKLLER